ncbi:hypothetical protein LEP1GSC051_4294 [Leptospira sp. P2653]|nr:hypothetical protein LEP1GSC051_4294 [Leptospira sp. P2653]
MRFLSSSSFERERKSIRKILRMSKPIQTLKRNLLNRSMNNGRFMFYVLLRDFGSF